MSKRNKTLLIILIILLGMLAFFWFTRETPETLAPGETPSTNFWSRFNPFNQNVPPSGPGTEPPPPGIEPPVYQSEELILRRISSMPIAGFTVYQKERYKELPPLTPPSEGGEETPTIPTPPETEFVPALRYVARANGNIWQTFADKIDERKFTSTLVPQVYEAYFGNRAEAVIMRYIKADERTIETFVAPLPKEVLGGDTTGENTLSGSFLPENITDLSVSPDTLKIFYLFESGENAFGITADFLGSKKVQVFDSPATEWLSGWPAAKLITLATKPAAVARGYLYALNPDSKSLVNILSGINGLTDLGSPNGKLILYADSSLSLYIYDLESRSTTALSARTLPEKCVWDRGSTFIYCAVPKNALGGAYPDVWYRGEVSSSDDIWKIDAGSGLGTIILEPTNEPGGEEIDGIKLALDEGENYLFFVNKKNSYLWEMKLR